MTLDGAIACAQLAAEQAAPQLSYDLFPSNRPPGFTPDKVNEDLPTEGFEEGATEEQRTKARAMLEEALKRAMRQGTHPIVVNQAPAAPRA